MSNVNVEAAREWVNGREWANGWTVNADATVDAVEFKEQYEANKELWDKLFSFLATTDLKALEPGKVDLVPGRLWINVLEYEPKDAAHTKIETHRNFIDLQYTYEGNELMGLAGVMTDYDPVKDRNFYSLCNPIEYAKATPDVFFLYFPKEMHQPSVKAEGEAVKSRKIVGKIEYKKK